MTDATQPEIDRDTVLGQYQKHINSGFARLARIINMPIEVRSEGCVVYDEHDEAYLDCGGYSVFLLGHRHPAIIDAVRAQLDRHTLATRVLLDPNLARAATMLAEIAPDGLEYVVFTNSGAEAAEVGLKLARLNGKRRVISTHGGFHGKTLGALSVTGKTRFQEPFQPLLQDVEFVEYGNAAALEAALSATSGDACVILEPIQGEGGVIIPPLGYLAAARALCDRYNALLIFDEIQTGLGRLGTLWGCQREDVTPDILLSGKVLSGGVIPVGAAITTPAVFAGINKDPFLHSSTYAGNPLAMSAVIATIETIRREDIVAKAATLGEEVMRRLKAVLNAECPDLIADIRGEGLLIGIEFVQDHFATDFIYELLRRKVVLSNSLNTSRVARLTPPALLNPAEVDWLFDAVTEAAAALSKRYSPAPVEG